MAEKEDFESSSSNLAESTDVTDGPARRGLARVIHNGLLVSIKGSKKPFISYSYAMAPCMSSKARMEWKILASESVECEHVMLHKLQQGDNMSHVIERYKGSLAVGIVLINCDNGYDLDDEFLSTFPGKKEKFPIIIITCEDGKSLRDFLIRHEVGELYVRIETKDQAPVDVYSRQSGRSESASPVLSRAGRRTGIRRSKMFRKKQTINIKEEVKQLMFPPSGPVCVSEDAGLFQVIMSTFYQYEQMVQREGHINDGAIFRKLTKHIDEVFARDFPLYLVLAYRVHKKQYAYRCMELSPFVQKCVESFERLEQIAIVKTLDAFLKREDLKIMYDARTATMTVFSVLEEACIEFMKMSYTFRTREGKQGALHPKYFYYRMLWITCAMKCHVARVARGIPPYWSEYLTSSYSLVHLDADTIQDIKKGVEFGKLSELPKEYCFNSTHMAELLASDGYFRPLSQMNDFVIVMEPFVDKEEDFILSFLKKPRECYATCFRQSLEDTLNLLNPDGNLLVVLQKGVSFLDTVLEICKKRGWRSNAMDEELRKWLTLLLSLVDVTNEKAESYLKDFLSNRTGITTKQYREHIKRQVICSMQENFSKLPVEQFLLLYRAFFIWPNWFVEAYLRQYKIPVDVSICGPIWSDFFSEFVDRFSDAHYHKALLDFLKSVAATYREQGRAKKFVLHLLKLDVSKLFVTDFEESTSTVQSDIVCGGVAEEFMAFLSDYIQRNSLKSTILSDFKTIWSCIADDNEFQRLVLQVLQKELIPDAANLQGTASQTVHFILQQCLETLCQDFTSLRQPTPHQSFCWGLVASCCNKIPLSEDFNWVSKYYSTVEQLGRIYSSYCASKKIVDENCFLESQKSFPHDVSECSSDDVKQYFRWIMQAQQLFARWKKKFTQKKVTFDQILQYAKHFSYINRVAASLSVEFMVVDTADVSALQTKFLQDYELLNILILRYVPGHPEAGWCTLLHLLLKFGVELPDPLLSAIKENVIFPGERGLVAKESLDRSLPPSFSKIFLPGQNIRLELKKNVTLDTLRWIVQVLDGYIFCIHDQLSTLVFFHLYESEIFDKHLKLQLRKEIAKSSASGKKTKGDAPLSFPPLPHGHSTTQSVTKGLSLETLEQALVHTHELIVRLVKGNASYMDIVSEGSLDLKAIEIDREFETFGLYATVANIHVENADGLKGVKCMMQLFQFASRIKAIHGVCQQYQLEGCLGDPQLKELVELVESISSSEERAKLTPNDAIKKMKKVRQGLFLEEGQNCNFLSLFQDIADSAAFHQFVVIEKGFVGDSGHALFRQQYQLITTHLQHEEYDETVLNHLYAAFKFITPFTDKTMNFESLIAEVSKLNMSDVRQQLSTVNRNIHLIRLWFSRAEGDTLQGVANELQCILHTGCYDFSFSSTVVGMSTKVCLRYLPVSEQSEGVRPSERLEEITCSDEQISDFVRRLGFLDSETEVGEGINKFLHLNQTAYKLLDLYAKLRELGHPNYLQETFKQVLQCRLSVDNADQKVFEVADVLSQWEKDVAKLRVEYEQLLFFSIPKLLHLYQLITASEPSVTKIVQEVSFLFQNKPKVRRKLKEIVKDILKTKKDDLVVEQKEGVKITPMHVVGFFLAELFKNLDLSNHSLKRRRPSVISSSQSTHILHSCSGFTQSQLIRLIISIYGGVPEAFEVFHCRSTTTEEDLRLFLNPKRATKHPFQYLILEVNKLSYQLQEVLLQLHFDLRHNPRSMSEIPCVHFIETSPSLLQEMPWILVRDYKGCGPKMEMEEAMLACQRSAMNPDDFSCIQIVYGKAGDGKSHYIDRQLQHCPQSLKIVINETFTPLNAIKKLASLPIDTPGCGIFFNFTLLPPGESVDETERLSYRQLIEVIGWFFFDLFVLGYVEDTVTGYSFRLPGGLSWAIYIEVPSRNNMSPEESLDEFYEEIPALGLLGTPHPIYPSTPYVVDKDVQLVCKYLKEYKAKGIDKLYRDVGGFLKKGRGGPLVKFSLNADLSDSECYELLEQYTPEHMKHNKTTQQLFIKYMKRRCEFLDNCPGFNYNTGSSDYVTDGGQKRLNDTKELGSTLMRTMLNEVSDYSDPIIRENWSLKPHHQLVYDFKDGGSSFGLMTLHPDQLPSEDVARFERIGIPIPSMMELYSRKLLDSVLSRVLGVPLNENGFLTPIDESEYVLTLDFAVKMLNIHERAECGVPVIIEGETGVGKTALVEMMSKLWNYSLLNEWNREKSRLLECIQKKLKGLPASSLEGYRDCVAAVESMSCGGTVREDDLILTGDLEDAKSSSGHFYSIMREAMLKMKDNPVISLLEFRDDDRNRGTKVKLSKLFGAAEYKNNSKATAKLLYAVVKSTVRSTFHKLNVHTALQPSDILNFFKQVIEQAKELKSAYESHSASRVPFVTVFLDEVNTSSCMGLFKEVIVDRSLDSQPIPDNIFIIGACNPHRGNSLAIHETWVRGSYYVRELHPTLQCITWDYGALGEYQEADYIKAKMRLMNEKLSNIDLANVTRLIVNSQKLMRLYACEHLKKFLSDDEASACSRSCVSQRDIQRIFTFYEWLMKMYDRFKPWGKSCDYQTRAVIVSLGIVYYLRLNDTYRKRYQEELDPANVMAGGASFLNTFNEEITWYINHVELPDGIAKTQALKENVFATIACTMTHTPLIIVGSPGSSKTLSFNIALSNLKGQESKKRVFRETSVFRSLDPQFYQCSRRTTCNEIETVFSRAVNRQRSHAKVNLPIFCVVFMDEAGLPEERNESLKVLHYHLDKQEVSFVAICNNILDAAKTNRAVSLFRSQASREDLETIAKGCICSNPDDPPPESKQDITIISSFCPAYESLMENPKLRKFFGLRDFIHFISYLRQNRDQMLTPQLAMKALERNFNGVDQKTFDSISKLFLKSISSSPNKVHKSNILEILHSSLSKNPSDICAENEARYKLVIDLSEDGSLMRLLFSSGVLQRKNTHVYICSDFPGDAQLQKINTIAAIRHSANEGHTIVMCQTDAIHESFYDLFNRRFHRIDTASGPKYYANIAIGAHIKPCRVDPNFECIVVVKQSEVDRIPHPFLNRFEKYQVSHTSLYEATLGQLPPYMSMLIQTAHNKTTEFLDHIGGSASIYGLQKDTVNSLFLTILPPFGHVYQPNFDPPPKDSEESTKTYIVRVLLQALQDIAGFQIPKCSSGEMALDSEEVVAVALQDSEFAGLFSDLSERAIQDAVTEALGTLHSTTPPKGKGKLVDVSVEACLMISVFLQWVIRYTCKHLMQLMTSEALCLYHKKIPSSYVQTYLKHQHHFSLKALISKHYSMITSISDDKFSSFPSKILCYTRTSQVLHQLPVQHPSPLLASAPSSGDSRALLSELVCNDLDSLVVYKLTNVSSFTNVSEVIKSFTSSQSQSILLIIANMQETSKEIINHLRIMVEEAEVQCKESDKLFVVLLHFPTSRLSDPCYPSIFLQGWDFYYLDIAGYTTAANVLDVREWFGECYYAQNPTSSTATVDSVTRQLNNILHEGIKVVASRIFFGMHSESSFNKSTSVTERTNSLKTLLFKKGVGEILSVRFISYWQPNVMVEYLEKAAAFAHSRETTVSVIDTLQGTLKSLFFDFLTYIVSSIDAEMNLDVLMDTPVSSPLHKLFINLLKVFPVPKLTELKMFRIEPSGVSNTTGESSTPRFPFFNLLSSEVQKLVEQSRQQLNQQHSFSGESSAPLSLLHTLDQGRAHTMSSLRDLVCSKLQEHMKTVELNCLGIALQAMTDSDDLWNRYFTDFLHCILHLDDSAGAIGHRILHAALGKLEDQNVINRIAILHVYFHVHKLNMAKLIAILRPLDKIQQVASRVPFSLSSSPAESLISMVGESENVGGRVEALSNFVLDTLFSAVVGIVKNEQTVRENLKLWYKVYQDVMLMPTLREYIYKSRSCGAEAQHNVMHAVFLVLQSQPSLDAGVIDKGIAVFEALFAKFFLQPSDKTPGLCDVATIAVESTSKVKFIFALSEENSQTRHIVEGLLEHFFHEYSNSYNESDCRWFFEVANKQSHWQCDYLIGAVVSGKETEELLSKLEFDPNPSQRLSSPPSEGSIDCISMSVFKFYLHRILRSSMKGPNDSLLLHFQATKAHVLIGQVLGETFDLGSLGPYIPTFYQDCGPIKPCTSAQNPVMQQPLSHLYFVLTLENLPDFDLAAVVRIAQNIKKQCDDDSIPDKEKVLLYVESQAVVQLVIQRLAQDLNLESDSKLNMLSTVLKEINDILDDETMGGGDVGGHGLVLMLYMLKELKSFTKLTALLTEKFSHLCEDIHCLRPFHEVLAKASKQKETLLFDKFGPDFKALFQKISSLLGGVHCGNTVKVKELVGFCEECVETDMKILSLSGESVLINKLLCFKMALWLCIYYEYFARNKRSHLLITALQDLSGYLEPQCVRLFIFFLNPELNKLLDVKSDSHSFSRQSDPLLDLFLGEDKDLCAAMVHMITVALGCQSKSTHLWYHIFAADRLVDSYITGCMLNSKIGPSSISYDQGVELTAEGLYGQQRYLKHATRGTLSLHSLYFVLWTNFAGFCVYLLTQNEASKLSGSILSRDIPVREYCASQVKKLWMHILNNMYISTEERLFLVKRCLTKLFELQERMRQGRLETESQLSNYEILLHRQVFLANWESLKDKFKEEFTPLQWSVFKDIHQLDVRYPHFPTEKAFFNSILSSIDISDDSNELYPLSQFVVEYEKLQSAGRILPALLELYQWIHTELVYAVAYKDATKLTLGRLAKAIAKFYSGGKEATYERLKVIYNEYVRLSSDLKPERAIPLEDNTPLIHLLSYSDEDKQGRDLLYAVIVNMIDFHNYFLERLLNAGDSMQQAVWQCCFPEVTAQVNIAEFTQHYSLVGRSRSIYDHRALMRMISKRSYLPTAFPTDPNCHAITMQSSLPGQLLNLVDMTKLQEDILATCIAGKPLIKNSSIQSLRVPFKFKDDATHSHLHDSSLDLENIAEKLPHTLKVPLDEGLRKSLEFEFHSSGYHAIMEMITGLKTAATHMIKAVCSDFGISPIPLKEEKLLHFLICLYEREHQYENVDIFREIGMHSLTQSQHQFLSNLLLPYLFHTLKLFVHWAKEGWYDFCSLPCAMKVPVTLPDEDAVRQIPVFYSGSRTELLRELKSLVETLVHMEAGISKLVKSKPETKAKPLSQYLRELLVWNDQDKLLQMIPESICLEHYVSVRLVLRRVVTEVQKIVSQEEIACSEMTECWDDFVSDLWRKKLPHLRDQSTVYTGVAPESPFLSGSHQESDAAPSGIINELMHGDFEENMLLDLEEYEDTETLKIPDQFARSNEDDYIDILMSNPKMVRVLQHRTQTIEVEELEQLASKYSVEDVVNFLHSIKLGEYAEAFRRDGINGGILLAIIAGEEVQALKELQVMNPVHRVKIQVNFRRQVLGIENQYPAEFVAQFLKSDNNLKQYADNFLKEEVDGDMLLKSDKEVLEHLGIRSAVHRLKVQKNFKSHIEQFK